MSIRFYLFALLVLFQALHGQMSPNSTVEKYTQFLFQWENRKAFQLITKDDQSYLDFDKYVRRYSIRRTSALESIIDLFSYEIDSVKVYDTTAIVYIQITEPDVAAILGDSGAAILSGLEKDDEDSLLKALKEGYKESGAPTISTLGEVQLVKQDGIWKIQLNTRKLDRIETLKLEAKRLSDHLMFNEAITIYKNILQLGQGILSFASERPEIERKLYTTSYLNKIEVRNVHVGEGTLGETGVFGEIKNHGNKTLTKVQIIIYCLDENGLAVFEKTYHPVLITEWSYGSDTPLRPNYSRKFGVKMDDAPSDWSGEVSVKVINLEFSEN